MQEPPTFPHPRPQLVRRDRPRILLDGPWKFRFDDLGGHPCPDPSAAWTHQIEVPFAPECTASGIADTGYHRCVWYERTFQVPNAAGRWWLHFGAVDYEAHVWVNGHFCGKHVGGNTPFSFDVTRALLPGTGGNVQTVTVRVDDDPHDLAKPRGKQGWRLDPHGIWYARTTGIWQSVWLENVPDTYLGRLRWTPHLERWEIGFEAFVEGVPREDLEVRVRLSLEGKLLVEDRYRVVAREVHRRIALSDPGIDDYRNELLWSPDRPTLIDASVELWSRDERLEDIQSYTALRSVALHRDRFMLNGRPYYLRLVLDQGYWPDTLMTAPNDEALRKDVELTKALGFNGVRKHQKIECPRYLYWADTLGLLVWEEMPSAYRFTHHSVERLVREWTAVIDRDYSHPCIVTWVPFNESWGVPDLAEKAEHRHCVQALYHLTKTLDGTRPVVGNDGWESTATDILGIHDYEGDPHAMFERYGGSIDLSDLLERKRPGGRMLTLEGHRHEGKPIVLTEFGGIALARRDDEWGYSTCRTPDELERRYTALLRAVQRSELFTGFCYTQLTDVFQEANGLLYFDRTPKVPTARIAQATRHLAQPPTPGGEEDVGKWERLTGAGSRMDSTP